MQSGPSTMARPLHRATESSTRAFNIDHSLAAGPQPAGPPPSFNANAPHEKIISAIINRIKTKLPYNSGTPVTVLEQDEAFNQAVTTLVHLARHRLDHITWTLCEMLDKMHGEAGHRENDLAYFQSQLLLAKILASAMYFRWESYKEDILNINERQPHSPVGARGGDTSEAASGWVDPPPLDDKVARYTMSVMVLFMKQTGSWGDRPKASGHIHSDTLYDYESIENHMSPPISAVKPTFTGNGSIHRKQTGSTTRRSGSIGGMVVPSSNGAFASSRIVTFSSPILASTVASVNALLSKYINKIIYFISASNWSVVFARIQQKIRIFASGSEEVHHDNTDMKLLSYCAMDQKRLVELFQELSSLLVSMKRDAQSSIALSLRNAIWNWINGFPEQFGETISSHRKLEGAPERVFDTLYQMMQDPGPLSTNRRIIWPTLAALLAISPERLRQSEVAMTGHVAGSRATNAYLPTVSSTLSLKDSKQSDIAMVCFLDLCKAAMCLPKSIDQSALRSLAPELASELRSRIMTPPQGIRPFYESSEPIDVNLYADILVAIFRFNAAEAIRSVFPVCLASKSDAVKTCVIRCLVTLVSEATRYETQPPIAPLRQNFARTVRAVFVGVLRDQERDPSLRQLHGRNAVKPTAKKYGTDFYSDSNLLLLTLLTLYRLDVSFYFHDMQERSELDVICDCVVLLSPQQDATIQATVAKSIHTLATGVMTMDPLAPIYPLARKHLKQIGLGVIIASASGAMMSRSNTECLRSYFSLINMVVSSKELGLLDVEGDTWSQEAIVQMRSLAVASGIHTLVASQLDIAVLASRTLRALSLSEVLPSKVPEIIFRGTEEYTKARHNMQALGDPSVPILGRAAFQRRCRKIMRSMDTPNAIQVIAWAEMYDCWIKITEKYLSAVKTNPSPPEDQKFEWQNVTLACAALSGGVFMERSAYGKVIAPFQPMLQYFVSDPMPERFRRASDYEELLRDFVASLVELLVHEDLVVRDVAKEALGSESQTKLYSMIIFQLDSVVSRLLDRRLPDWNPANTPILIEQAISVLRLIFDRIETIADGAQLNVDVTHIVLQLSAFLNSWSSSLNTIRIKIKFCNLCNSLFSKSDILALKKSVAMRNQLLDSIHQWVNVISMDWPMHERDAMLKLQADLDFSCIQAAATMLDRLRLQPLDGSGGLESGQAISSLFSKYLNFFVLALERTVPVEDALSDRGSAASKPVGPGSKEQGSVRELAILGISNMLSANMDAGIKHCLSFGYHDDPRMRATFILIFTRVLKQGARFDGVEPMVPRPGNRRLCEMVRGDLLLALAVCETCPVNEVDIMLPVMINIFDTRSTLVSLLRGLIDKEMTRSERPTELFRANTMCTRLLVSVAKVHGYSYLRMIIAPLLAEMAQNPTMDFDSTTLSDEEKTANLNNLKRMAQMFLDRITDSVALLPPLVREICAHIAEKVSIQWPESKYAVVGGFLFLRFINPSIVTPETIDLSAPPPVRRGLLLITKIIQNLANNVLFGREQFMMILNDFLEENILRVTQFLSDVVTLPEYDQEEAEEWHGSSYDEADAIVLHRFFHRFADKVGKELLGFSRMSMDDEASQTGKQTWDNLCSTLVEMGQPVTIPPPSKDMISQHQLYQEFMRTHEHRSKDLVRDLFYALPTPQGHSPVYALLLHRINVETVELDILTMHIFKTLASNNQPYDVIFDCTGFTSTSEIPLLWLRIFLERCPYDFVQNFSRAFILNANNAAMKFLRKLYHMSGGIALSKSCFAVSSIADLQQHLPDLQLQGSLRAADLDMEKSIIFEEVAQQSRHSIRLPISLIIYETYLRIVSFRSQPIWPGLECHVNEIILFSDIGDVYNISTGHEPNEFIVRRSRYGGTLYFSSLERDVIVHTIRMAKGKSRVENLHSYERTYSSGEVSATLLNISLLNLGSDEESLRNTAYDLATAVAASLNFDDSATLPVNGAFMPSSPLSVALHISDKLSVHSPNLTLDFIAEFARGYFKSSRSHRAICLQYLQPWIKNLSTTPDPANVSTIQPATKLRDSFRILIDLVVKDHELSPVAQRIVWTEVAKLEPGVISIALDELVRAASDGGIGSRRCELAAETMVVISSISVRGKILSKLRKAIGKTILRPSQALTASVAWNEVAAISRLALYAGYNTRVPAHNQLFVAETAHLITLLAGSGPVLMRTTIFGMAVNLAQSLYVSKADDPAVAPKLKQLLEDAHKPEILSMFGLVANGPIGDYSLPDSTSDTLPIDTLEDLSRFMLKMISLGAQSSLGSNLINVWRARWMSLIISTAFHCSYIQSRAFVVMGVLATSDVDDDLLYQILVAFKNALAGSSDGDTSTSAGILRCITKVIPGTPHNGRYLSQIVWLAIALMEYGEVALFAEAADLLRVSLETLDKQGLLDNMTLASFFFEARSPLEEVALQIDDYVGLSFETNFSFSLAAIIFRGLRHPQKRVQTSSASVLRLLLKFAARSAPTTSNTSPEEKSIPPDALGYFLALLPTVCRASALQGLLKDAGVGSTWLHVAFRDADSDEASKARVPLQSLGINEDNTALLVATVLGTMLNSATSIDERETLLCLLADMSTVYPEVIEQIYESIQERIIHSFSNVTNPGILSAVGVIFRTSMLDVLPRNAQGPRLNGSASTIGTAEQAQPQNQASRVQLTLLEEMQMRGILAPHNFLPRQASAQLLHCMVELVTRIVE